MRRVTRAVAFLLAFLLAPTAEATLSVIKRDKFDLNWFFRNTSTKYTVSGFTGFYRDYNNDGLPDYLMCLRDLQTGDWRMFTLNTASTGGEKLFPTHRTAGRDITAQFGVFMPDTLFTPYAPSMDVPDLVVVGTNDITTNSTYSQFTKFIFWRLNKANPSWPTEATWSIDVVSSDTPQVYWPDVSFDGDEYPDFIIYNMYANANKQFTISCYNGLNGARIWSRTLALDPQDPGTGISFIGGVPSKSGGARPMGFPLLNVYVLPHRPEHGVVGDFDGNGKSEIFLHYAFGRGSIFTTYSMTSDINLLNSGGNFVSPYTASWTRLREVLQTLGPLAVIVTTDYNRDSYVDLLLLSLGMGTPPPPVFEGYDLKNRRFLFNAVNSDFGTAPEDFYDYFALDEYSHYGSRPTDVNRDGWSDLLVYRQYGAPPDMPLRVGVFNAVGGFGSLKGRKMWLRQFDTFNRVFPLVNDFNGDNLMDYALVREPDTPDSPTVGQVTFRIANTAVSATGITLGKQFTYSPAHTYPWSPGSDAFTASTHMMFYPGDVDGDRQKDTLVCMASGFDAGNIGGWDLSYGYVLLYDNTPGLTPPPTTAELQFRVQSEDWIPYPVVMYAFLMHGLGIVDSNRDGYANDIVVHVASKAVYSMSFQYRVPRVAVGPPQLQAAILADFDNNGADAGDQLVLNLDQGVLVTTTVLRASHFFLPVQGDSMGGTGFRVNTTPHNARQIILTLGQGAHLTPAGIFSMTQRTSGSPSGVDFATSLPVGMIRSFDGISAVDGGAPGVNDSGMDIRVGLVGQSRPIGNRGGSFTVVNSPDAAYVRHQLTVPSGALATTLTFNLSPPGRHLGIPNAVRVVSSNPAVTFTRNATIGVEYHEGDIDWDSGYIEGEMYVHQLVEEPAGVFNYIPVPGRRMLGSAPKQGSSGVRKLAGETGQVTVDVDDLNPLDSLGTSGIFAGLPVETVDERTVNLKPGSGGILKGEDTTAVSPDPGGAYTLHQIEFPGYVTTTETDPNRIIVKIRTATLAERYAAASGQSFPSKSGAVFAVTVTNASGVPFAFTTPVTLTVQFKDRPDPSLSDVVHFDESKALPSNMRLVRDRLEGEGVDFVFVDGLLQTVNTALGTVTIENLTGLTGTDGMGTFGVVAPQGATPVGLWSLYR